MVLEILAVGRLPLDTISQSKSERLTDPAICQELDGYWLPCVSANMTKPKAHCLASFRRVRDCWPNPTSGAIFVDSIVIPTTKIKTVAVARLIVFLERFMIFN